MLGLFVMAVLWSGLGIIAGKVDWNTVNTEVFQGGPEGFGPTAVNIIFGSWFGRILIETGIARTIIRKAVELGGDRPALTCILYVLLLQPYSQHLWSRRSSCNRCYCIPHYAVIRYQQSLGYKFICDGSRMWTIF